MKSKLLKSMVIFLTLLMVISVFAVGCTTDEPEETQETQETATDSEETAEPTATMETLELVDLQFYFPGDKPADADMVMEAIREATADGINVNVELTFISWSDYNQKISVITAAGETFDGAFGADWLYYVSLANKGAFLDITELAQEYAPNWMALLSEDDVNGTLVNGKQYALPWNYKKNMRRTYQLRTDVAQYYGLENNDSSITTLEDVYDLSMRIKEDFPDIIPFAADLFEEAWLQSQGYVIEMAGNVTYNINDPDMELVSIFEVPGYEDEVLTYREKLMENELIAKDAGETSEELLVAGKIAGRIHAFGSYARVNENVAATNADWIGVTTFDLYSDQTTQLAASTNNLFVINAASDEPERALMFLNWIFDSQDNYDLWLYGIEGTHYVLTDNGKVDQPEGVDSLSNGYYDWEGQWAFWMVEFKRYAVGDTDEYIALEEYSMNNNSVQAPHTGWSPSDEDLETELALTEDLQATKLDLVGYYIDIEEWDTLIAEYKEIGGDKIVEEYQSQLDTWIAENQT